MADIAPLNTNHSELADLVGVDEVDAYVHIGEGTDDLLRYLTRVDGEDNNYAFAHTGDTTAVFVPPRYVREAGEEFPGDELIEIETDDSAMDAVEKYLGDKPSIRVPETVPIGIVHDLESFASVEIIDEPDTVWCEKNSDELKILREIAQGVQNGFAQAETVLAEAEIRGEQLVWSGEQLTTDKLRQEIRKALADCGLSDFGNIIIGAGPSCANLHFTGSDIIGPHETVLIDLGPRAPTGYYGDMTRTFVPIDPPEWALEMFTAVDQALEAAFDTLEDGAGVTAGELYGSMTDTLESHGYETGVHETQGDAVGLTHGTGHGIGVRIHEKPFQTADSSTVLEAGNMFTIEPGVYDPERGGVRLEDVVYLTEDGYENLIDYPRDIRPSERTYSPKNME